ncbi:lysylphosphatidylglycerol synthase transmembrane domain-containing protein [Methylocystis sp. B8]|uniref:lysylphosphatidylglycerol synthase transmembrane domain-containing protein n=1 Tax=Methylocystis sp. B8 TaxID=544938 RepID=UPI001FEFC3BF|nr:lysylphosphatidylglycerol synthase transmembrane domain-containing protein [Methylocystis sp. B8]
MSVEDDRLRPTPLTREFRLSAIVSPAGGFSPSSMISEPQLAAGSLKYISQRGGYVALVLNASFLAFISYWLYHNIEFADLASQLKQIPLTAILVAMTMNVFVLLFYGSRLSTLLDGGLFSGFLIATMGFTFNSLIPLRAGEGVKIYFGHSYFNHAIGGISAAVLLEKLYDLTAITILSLLILASSDSNIIDPRMLIAAALVVSIVFGGMFFFRRKGVIWSLPKSRIIESMRLDAIFQQAERLIADHSAARAAFFTASIWMTNVCLVYVAFRMLLPEIEFGFIHAMTLLIIGALAIAVPASPAGLGLFEAGIVAYLVNAYGVQKERAISAALAYHFSITAPHTLIVIGFLGIAFFRWLKQRSTA